MMSKRFNVTAKIYSNDLSADLINRVECRIEIDSKLLSSIGSNSGKNEHNSNETTSNNSTHINKSARGGEIDDTVVSNPTLLIDDQLLKASTGTITTLIALLVLTLFAVIACCSGLVWFKCHQKNGRGARNHGFASSSASSMSTGSPHSPLSELAATAKNGKAANKPNDLRRVFSIRLPFDIFDKRSSESNQINSKKFNVISTIIIFLQKRL